MHAFKNKIYKKKNTKRCQLTLDVQVQMRTCLKKYNFILKTVQIINRTIVWKS